MLHWIWQQIWKNQQWLQDWKRSVFIPIPKKGNTKECWYYHTIALILHTSSYVQNPSSYVSAVCEPQLPDVQAGFRKGRGTRDQITNICWIIKKAREFQKNIYFCSIDYTKAFDCVNYNKLENSERDGNTRPSYSSPEKSVCRSRSKLEPYMEQRTSSKLGKEYIKAVYCHPAYLTQMHSTSWEMSGRVNQKLESRLPGEISITSHMQIIPL